MKNSRIRRDQAGSPRQAPSGRSSYSCSPYCHVQTLWTSVVFKQGFHQPRSRGPKQTHGRM